MAELSSFTRKVLSELAPALASYTPEKIKACGIAEAEALKLTEPEKAKRDEAVAILNSVAPALKKLEDAKKDNEASLKALAEATAAQEKSAAFAKQCNEAEATRLDKIKTDLEAREKQLSIDQKALKEGQDTLLATQKYHIANVRSFEESKKAAKEKSKKALAEIDAA